MPFKRGASGNPKGRPKGARDKTPRTFRALVTRFVQAHHGDITAAMRHGVRDKQHAHRYLAIAASLERQQIEHSGPDGEPVTIRFIDA